jgi:hypothetical protein
LPVSVHDGSSKARRGALAAIGGQLLDENPDLGEGKDALDPDVTNRRGGVP